MLKEQIENYIPFDEQEQKDKEQFLEFINTFDDVLTRNNIFGHFTASAFVVNKDRTKMAVIYHIINDGWSYPGGMLMDAKIYYLLLFVKQRKKQDLKLRY